MMVRLAADAITLANLRMKKMTAKYALGKPKEICFEELRPEIGFEEKFGVKTPLAIENLSTMKEDFGL